MSLKIVKSIVLTLLLASTFGCSTAPTHLIVSPQVSLSPSNQLSGKEAKLSVIDMRTSTHIIQILEKNEAAVILSSEQRLEGIIEGTLSATMATARSHSYQTQQITTLSSL